MTDVATERVLLVSGDSHVGPKTEALREYCPKRYLEQYDEHLESPMVQMMRQFRVESRNLKTEGHHDAAARLAIALDGEVKSLAVPLTFTLEPGGLTVIAPLEEAG